MQASDLTVLAVISNPVRYHSREALFHDFAAAMHKAGVHLVVVEAAFGDRPWKVTRSDHGRINVDGYNAGYDGSASSSVPPQMPLKGRGALLGCGAPSAIRSLMVLTR